MDRRTDSTGRLRQNDGRTSTRRQLRLLLVIALAYRAGYLDGRRLASPMARSLARIQQRERRRRGLPAAWYPHGDHFAADQPHPFGPGSLFPSICTLCHRHEGDEIHQRHARVELRPDRAHPFQTNTVDPDTPDRPCTLCGQPDRAPIHKGGDEARQANARGVFAMFGETHRFGGLPYQSCPQCGMPADHEIHEVGA